MSKTILAHELIPIFLMFADNHWEVYFKDAK